MGGYEEIVLLKRSEKSTVHLVRERDSGKIFVRKVLEGKKDIYLKLQNCEHPYLPKLYEVSIADDSTTVIEEYIEGESLGEAELAEKQLLGAARELCSVLDFLHKKDIVHRDVKPSNIILAKDGHIRLIDFDAARQPKDDLEQDTRLLGTRGYAPPEQYGFAQTDARTDIYAFGITLKQLLGDKAQKICYRHIIQKCTNWNPEKRYQSAGGVKRAFFYGRYGVWCGCFFLMLFFLWGGGIGLHQFREKNMLSDNSGLPMLDAPAAPHWNDETGIAVWGNVPGASISGEVGYHYRIYRQDTETPPEPGKDMCIIEDSMYGAGMIDEATDTYRMNMSDYLQENGFYYFEVCAAGDGIQYTDSEYVMSDAFKYTGESAPALPVPTGLQWRLTTTEEGRGYYATWNNLDDYADTDSFNVCVYDKNGNYVTNNIWTKKLVMERGYSGIRIRPEFFTEEDGAFRFTVQAYTSRPNEYKSSPMPDPVPEEYFSPWYIR